MVAIVEETNPDTDKGALYGNLARKALERSELEKCIELNTKAVSFNKNLTSAKFNIAFVHLLQEKDQALEEYVTALSELKNDQTPKYTLSVAIQDIRIQRIKQASLKNIKDIEDLLNSEIKKY